MPIVTGHIGSNRKITSELQLSGLQSKMFKLIEKISPCSWEQLVCLILVTQCNYMYLDSNFFLNCRKESFLLQQCISSEMVKTFKILYSEKHQCIQSSWILVFCNRILIEHLHHQFIYLKIIEFCLLESSINTY